MVYRIADGVTITEYVDSIALEMGGEKYTISGSGIQFFKLIDGERDMDQILRELVRVFGPNVEPYVLARDLERFVYELSIEGLLVLVKTHFEH